MKESIILDNTVLDKNSCVLYSIVSEDCRIGPWARVEGSPLTLNEEGKEKQTISILGSQVHVTQEVLIRRFVCVLCPVTDVVDGSLRTAASFCQTRL